MDDNQHGSDYIASSSGCSSGIGTSASNTDKNSEKRIQVRKCIAELKAMVVSQRGEKTGTLNTLQHVLAHLKKVKEVGEEGDAETSSARYDTERLGGAFDGDTGKKRFSVPLCKELGIGNDDFKYKITLGPKQHEVMDVSAELLELLGYPKNYWFAQSITQYVYKKDIVTVSSNLAFNGKSTEPKDAESEQNVFFFRLRHYKNLRQGFSLNRPNKFSVFCAKASVQKVALEFPSDAPVQRSPPDGKYIVLQLTLMQSAYKSADGVPEQRSFSTRHTISCNYSFVHPSAIALLGYLPQDMIGASVFDFYHPHDMSVLLGIYQEVVIRPGQTYKSLPYRMKTRNGSYVTIETEWSSFVNPWTHKLDFIIGKSEIILGPDNLDVFADSSSSRSRANVNLERQQISLQKQIRALLMNEVQEPRANSPMTTDDHILETLPSVPSPTDTTTNTPITVSISSGKSPHEERAEEKFRKEAAAAATTTAKALEEFKQEKARRLQRQTLNCGVLAYDRLPVYQYHKKQDLVSDEESLGDLTSSTGSRRSYTEDEKARIYQRLNYANNIRRFLMSCHSSDGAGTDSSEDIIVKEVSSSDNATAESTADFSVNMDISLAKPPSFASSTKAMISEHERDEPQQDESEIEAVTPHNLSTTTSIKDAPTPASATPAPPSVEEIYTPVPLTESVLKTHNKLQEQSYINKMITEKCLLPSSGADSGSNGDYSKKICKKRKTQGGEVPIGPHKHFRSEGNAMQSRDAKSEALPLHPPFNVTTDASSLQAPVTTNAGLPLTMSLPIITSTSPLSSANMQRGNQSATLQDLPQVVAYAYPMATPSGNAMSGAEHHGGRNIAQMVPISTQQLSMPGQALQGIRWPMYHPQTGIPVVQPFLYQPLTGQIVQPSIIRGRVYVPSTTGTSDSSYYMPRQEMDTSSHWQEMRQSDDRNADSGCKIEESGSMEESDPSLLYLLESSVINTSTSDDPQDSSDSPLSSAQAKARLPNAPPWVQDCEWNNYHMMEYTMPKRKAKAILAEDKAILSRMKQSVDVVRQMQELQGYVDEGNGGDPTLQDEEADLLYWLPESRSHEQEKSEPSSSTNLKHAPGDQVEDADASNVVGGAGTELVSGGEEIKVTASQDDDFADSKSDSETSSALDKLDINESTDVKMGEDQKNLNKNDDKMETGSVGSGSVGSKSSSCITPSDERSNDENVSSLKESDNASSESGSLNDCAKKSHYSYIDDTDDECETDAKEKKKRKVKLKQQFFTTLRVDYGDPDDVMTHATQQTDAHGRRYSAPSLPQWLLDVDFNQRVQMQYVSPPLGRTEVLQEDQKRMQSMRQPQLVKEQMSELFATLGKEVGEALDVGALDVQYHSSSSDVTMDDESPTVPPPPPGGLPPDDPMAGGSDSSSSDGSPLYRPVKPGEPATYSSTESDSAPQNQTRRPVKGKATDKGGPVKSSSRKASKADLDATEEGEKDSTGGAANEETKNLSDNDSGAEMQVGDDSTQSWDGNRNNRAVATDNHTTSDSSDPVTSSSGKATMSSSMDVASSSLDTLHKNTDISPTAIDFTDCLLNKHTPAAVTKESCAAENTPEDNTMETQLLESLFTDDDHSNI